LKTVPGLAQLRRLPAWALVRDSGATIRAIVQGLAPSLIVGFALAGAAGAQEAAPLTDPGQKTVRIVRTTTKPTIDGVVNPAEWAGAARIDDLIKHRAGK